MTQNVDFLYSTFEKLHSIPEIGFEEYKTSEFLAGQLKEMGFTVTEKIGKTGILGVLDSGNPGPCLAFRGDMDALPFVVDGKPTAIHACGHDSHCTMVLTALKTAAENGIKRGKLAVIFQQAEEKVGSIEMAESGKLGIIDELIGIHLRPSTDALLGQATPSLVHGAGKFITMEINGLAAHASRPHLGINALNVATSIITAVNGIRENPQVPYSIKATQIRTIGNSFNTIPDKVELVFDMRAQTNQLADSILEKLEKIARTTAEAYGATIGKYEAAGCIAAEFDDELTACAKKAIENVLGEALDPLYTVGCDDFHYFTKILGCKTAFIGLGCDMKYGLHHADMSFDHKAMEHGAEILGEIIKMRLC